MADRFEAARSKIYAAHDEDPTKQKTSDGSEVPYESHYSQKMESYLSKRAPNASDVLRLAICGQHFRRWEVPRSSYPMTKLGYHQWRTYLKKRQAELVGQILKECGYSTDDIDRCIALIEKEGLKQGEEEVQVLEDVACLVFLDDQFDEFQTKHDESKLMTILQKTWGKMSKEGQDMALHLPMTDESRTLVEKALAG
ncbi:related to CYB2-L-lactate dehydrogenase (cytochrome b2) [Ramularia collo-cygni]|uniref:Related to CYB2-L-lactate dehydrogenase (Cytochrome b2) n=1 Tax=Ramularia collo-cygni TaxID=112498 RepID=A0A2D3VE14_9PEZI|nr:related to CYB2-L-lactate dehydrogenase (cytochrome b2) [Ramularia collo-cygni]CZT19959.1 related to CYB2-L-lactate dehydrogenase (cytochrome b2) [Ramularia collo-cygni]